MLVAYYIFHFLVNNNLKRISLRTQNVNKIELVLLYKVVIIDKIRKMDTICLYPLKGFRGSINKNTIRLPFSG